MSERTPLEIANEILNAVEEAAPGDLGVTTEDRNERLLVAGYGRAYRCFSSIRDLAARGEADDAEVLTRTLLSITLHSLYLVQPDDPKERRLRFARASRSYVEELRKAAREEHAAGIDLAREIEGLTEKIDQFDVDGIPSLPSDYDIARSLDLDLFYTRVYRPGSNASHYSIGAALDGFLELTQEDLIGPVSLLKPEPEKAADILIRAALTYGAFLERCDTVIRHGVTDLARSLLTDYFNHTNASTSD